MNIKKVKTLGVLITFLLCFLIHFLYDWFPNSFFSIFSPVNESIWEHMKLIATSYIIYGLIDYLLLKKYSITHNNFLLQLFIIPIIGILLYLIIYLPLYSFMGESMIISLTLLFVIIMIMHIISSNILKLKPLKYESIIGVLGIIIIYIIFGILTYKPPKTELFLDKQNKQYGINIYQIPK